MSDADFRAEMTGFDGKPMSKGAFIVDLVVCWARRLSHAAVLLPEVVRARRAEHDTTCGRAWTLPRRRRHKTSCLDLPTSSSSSQPCPRTSCSWPGLDVGTFRRSTWHSLPDRLPLHMSSGAVGRTSHRISAGSQTTRHPRADAPRSIVCGLVVAAIMGASYPYIVLKLGFGPNVSVVAAFFGYLALGIVFRNYNRWENNIVQTAGTAGAQTAFMCVLLAAFDMLAASPNVSFSITLSPAAVVPVADDRRAARRPARGADAPALRRRREADLRRRRRGRRDADRARRARWRGHARGAGAGASACVASAAVMLMTEDALRPELVPVDDADRHGGHDDRPASA